MASKTQIVNIGMARIGVNKQIANVDTETSREAVTAKMLFDDDVLYVLRDFPWPWATTYSDPGLVAGSASSPVNNDWIYSYRYPSDGVFVRRIVNTEGRKGANPPPFRIGRDSQGKLIYTNEQNAGIEYTALITNPEEFDALFVSMLAWKIGAGCAPSLSRIKDMAQTCMQMYEIDKSKAQSRALNEGQQEVPLDAELIRMRD